MRNRTLPFVFIMIVALLIAVGVLYAPSHMGRSTPAPEASQGTTAPTGATAATGVQTSPSPGASGGLSSPRPSNLNPDLTVDANGLSNATVALNTSVGLIRFKFYPQDAPETVKRLVQLINQGFYNGLIFHRVEKDFVIQTGDPQGTGMGGSGVKLKAEFNNRRHIEGTLAMARTADPNSADSQFYISLGTLPTLDHSYTVFGQVIEGMDVARKVQKGDKIVSMIIE